MIAASSTKKMEIQLLNFGFLGPCLKIFKKMSRYKGLFIQPMPVNLFDGKVVITRNLN